MARAVKKVKFRFDSGTVKLPLFLAGMILAGNTLNTVLHGQDGVPWTTALHTPMIFTYALTAAIVWLSILLHEVVHAVTATTVLRSPEAVIRFSSQGGYTRFAPESDDMALWRKLVVTLSPIFVCCLLAPVLLVGYVALGSVHPVVDNAMVHGLVLSFLFNAFNLLPVKGFDGYAAWKHITSKADAPPNAVAQ